MTAHAASMIRCTWRHPASAIGRACCPVRSASALAALPWRARARMPWRMADMRNMLKATS